MIPLVEIPDSIKDFLSHYSDLFPEDQDFEAVGRYIKDLL